jgi:hypothetical protein
MNAANSGTVYQTNSAAVANNVESSAATGNNNATENTNGSVHVLTGDASNITGVSNELNFNSATMDSLMAMNLTGNISGNGADSNNALNFGLTNTNNTTQMNEAEVSNNLDTNSNSGNNTASENTGGSVMVDTGSSDLLTGIDNMLNFNSADVGSGNTSIADGIGANGADSNNTIGSNNSLDQLTFQTNDALLANAVAGANSGSGGNDASENTGVGSNSSVMTGGTLTATSTSNSVNINQQGSPIVTLPGISDFGFQVSWNWVQFFNMFHF